MNPAAMLKYGRARKIFEKNHPKFAAFIRYAFGDGVKEDTVIEVTVREPGKEPVTANLRVKKEDLELIKELKA